MLNSKSVSYKTKTVKSQEKKLAKMTITYMDEKTLTEYLEGDEPNM